MQQQQNIFHQRNSERIEKCLPYTIPLIVLILLFAVVITIIITYHLFSQFNEIYYGCHRCLWVWIFISCLLFFQEFIVQLYNLKWLYKDFYWSHVVGSKRFICNQVLGMIVSGITVFSMRRHGTCSFLKAWYWKAFDYLLLLQIVGFFTLIILIIFLCFHTFVKSEARLVQRVKEQTGCCIKIIYFFVIIIALFSFVDFSFVFYNVFRQWKRLDGCDTDQEYFCNLPALIMVSCLFFFIEVFSQIYNYWIKDKKGWFLISCRFIFFQFFGVLISAYTAFRIHLQYACFAKDWYWNWYFYLITTQVVCFCIALIAAGFRKIYIIVKGENQQFYSDMDDNDD